MRLAELTDLSISYISHIETAKKKPSLESILKIVNALNVTVDELMWQPDSIDDNFKRMMFAHELGHALYHRAEAKEGLSEFTSLTLNQA